MRRKGLPGLGEGACKMPVLRRCTQERVEERCTLLLLLVCVHSSAVTLAHKSLGMNQNGRALQLQLNKQHPHTKQSLDASKKQDAALSEKIPHIRQGVRGQAQPNL
jgi:hypothetical protein